MLSAFIVIASAESNELQSGGDESRDMACHVRIMSESADMASHVPTIPPSLHQQQGAKVLLHHSIR